VIKCNYCGKEHKPGKTNCPASGKKCNKCKGNNHFSSVCQTKVNVVRSIRTDGNDTTSSGINADLIIVLFPLLLVQERNMERRMIQNIFTVSSGVDELPTVYVSLGECGPILMHIDTCSTCNIIDEETFNKLSPRPSLKTASTTAVGFQSKTPINFLGEFWCKLKLKCKFSAFDAKVCVVKGAERCLLSFKASDELGLVKIVDSVSREHDLTNWKEKYPNVFSGKLGKLKDFELKLDIDESIRPVVTKRFPLPFHTREEVEKIVQKGVTDDIFERATGPTTWLLNPFLVKKSGGRKRFVVDASVTKHAVKRTRHQLPTTEELIADINDSKFFSKFDLLDGFHQVPLAEESRHKTTFRAPSGLYRYKRLIQGNSAVPEFFHKIIETQVINGLTGSRNVFDDILVHGKDEEEHDKNVDALLKRLDEKRLTVNVDKCLIKRNKVEFFGLIFSKDGISPAQDKIKA
jgi:hypothetical protein